VSEVAAIVWLQWDDRLFPTTAEADRLRQLFGWIVALSTVIARSAGSCTQRPT
jgi:hypothetical protein